MEPVEMIRMVRELNKYEVPPMEVLSGQIYEYDHDKETLSMWDIKHEGMKEETAFVRMSVCLKNMNLYDSGIGEPVEGCPAFRPKNGIYRF